MTIEKSSSKKSWLTVGLFAAALTLGACGKKDESPMETDSPVDAQTAVEEEATSSNTAITGDADNVDVGVGSTMSVGDNDNIGVASANDGRAVGNKDDVAVASAEGTAVASGDTVEVGSQDNADMLDGTEDQEHVSTY